MLSGLMRIPLGHRQRAVPERLGHFSQARAVHGQVGRRCVAQIVEPAVLFANESGSLSYCAPWPIKVCWRIVTVALEHPTLLRRVAIEVRR